ncbi:hypothetical protein HPP92_012798 [Vanilla planifolia]|uniref:Uncharacterized protein n=1 Tax=Vanilla planifolia TaxID=51239 RepID=A0A835QYZ7_VANPL|nr:hypothetical protein HPP92_013223 [Vanilla planifolia]KAG0478079.1 hypothetical protein HPP92_012798 [Vanilla planifolia]
MEVARCTAFKLAPSAKGGAHHQQIQFKWWLAACVAIRCLCENAMASRYKGDKRATFASSALPGRWRSLTRRSFIIHQKNA